MATKRQNPVDFGVLAYNYGYGTASLAPVDSSLYKSSGSSGEAAVMGPAASSQTVNLS